MRAGASQSGDPPPSWTRGCGCSRKPTAEPQGRSVMNEDTVPLTASVTTTNGEDVLVFPTEPPIFHTRANRFDDDGRAVELLLVMTDGAAFSHVAATWPSWSRSSARCAQPRAHRRAVSTPRKWWHIDGYESSVRVGRITLWGSVSRSSAFSPGSCPPDSRQLLLSVPSHGADGVGRRRCDGRDRPRRMRSTLRSGPVLVSRSADTALETRITLADLA